MGLFVENLNHINQIYTGLRDIYKQPIYTNDVCVILVNRERLDRNFNTRSKWDGIYMAKAKFVFNYKKQSFEFQLLEGEEERITKLRYGERAPRYVDFGNDGLIHTIVRDYKDNEITYGSGIRDIYDLDKKPAKLGMYYYVKNLTERISRDAKES